MKFETNTKTIYTLLSDDDFSIGFENYETCLKFVEEYEAKYDAKFQIVKIETITKYELVSRC